MGLENGEERLNWPAHPAADRVAVAIVSSVSARSDFRTLLAWGRQASPSASRGTLRAWCHSAGIVPHLALDFARAIRCVHLSETVGGGPTQYLDFVDPRALRRFLARGSLLLLVDRATPYNVADFLHAQSFLEDRELVAAVRRLWSSGSPPAARPEWH